MEHCPPKERCPGCDWKWTAASRNRPLHTCEELSPDKATLRVLREEGPKCENRQQLHELVARSGLAKKAVRPTAERDTEPELMRRLRQRSEAIRRSIDRPIDQVV